jgi:hypothetical protein
MKLYDTEIIFTVLPRAKRLLGFIGPTPPLAYRRIFSDEALQAEIDRVTASLPADKRAAKINFGFYDGGVQGVIVVKPGKDWTIQGGVLRDKGGVWSGQVSAEWTF